MVSLTSGGPPGFPGEVSYGAAKAALENDTMSATLELADHGVTANMLMPAVTDTVCVRPASVGTSDAQQGPRGRWCWQNRPRLAHLTHSRAAVECLCTQNRPELGRSGPPPGTSGW